MKKINKLLILLVLFIANCGIHYPHNKQIYYETGQIEKLVLEFQQEHLYYTGNEIIIDDLIIKITTEEDREHNKLISIGTCSTGYNKTPVIKLDKVYWMYTSLKNKKRLIYHELGHCVLDYEHPPKDAKGIMSAVTIPYREYIDNEKEYIKQFFIKGI